MDPSVWWPLEARRHKLDEVEFGSGHEGIEPHDRPLIDRGVLVVHQPANPVVEGTEAAV